MLSLSREVNYSDLALDKDICSVYCKVSAWVITVSIIVAIILKIVQEKNYRSYIRICDDTVGEKKDWTKRDFRSKTTLITGGVSRTWVNPPFCKMATFFHRSLALSMPIYRNFQSNGVKWRSIKLRKQFFYKIGYYINCFFQSLKRGHLPLFDWKCL